MQTITQKQARRAHRSSCTNLSFREWARLEYAGRLDCSPKLARILGGRKKGGRP